jgi:phosphoglycolate phosphatase-like HAD superfamily hydrolase
MRRLGFALLLLAVATNVLAAGDPLPSWNDTAPKKAIVAFVSKVTSKGSSEFVPPEARIATFDNDGTLWAEQPMYFQMLFAIDRVKELAPQHPEWKSQEPFKDILAGNTKAFFAGGEKSVQGALAVTHAGMTTDEFVDTARNWVRTAKHPKTGTPYIKMVYQPMVELLAYLRANGFKTYIVSGGGVEFMRAFAQEAYGIPPEQVIGSSGKLKYELRDGKPVLLKQPAVQFVDDREGKPINIQTIIGRRPIAALGNSDGDLQMLQWTTAGTGARLGLLVHHTDATREWAYDRKSPIGALDKALDAAHANDWVVVDMKDDWRNIFPK